MGHDNDMVMLLELCAFYHPKLLCVTHHPGNVQPPEIHTGEYLLPEMYSLTYDHS